MNIFLFFVLILDFSSVKAEPEGYFNFFTEYFSALQVGSVTFFSCNDKGELKLLIQNFFPPLYIPAGENFKLNKHFSMKGILFNFINLEKYDGLLNFRQMEAKYHKQGIVVDMKCPNSMKILQMADENHFFLFHQSLTYWLVLYPTTLSKNILYSLINDYVPKATDLYEYLMEPYTETIKGSFFLLEINKKENEEVLRNYQVPTFKATQIPNNETTLLEFLELNILLNNKIVIGIPALEEEISYVLYHVYKITKESRAKIQEVGKYRLADKNNNYEQIPNILGEKKNLGNEILKGAIAVFFPEKFTTIEDISTKDDDVWSKISYPHIKLLSEDLHFRFILRYFDYYGYSINGTFSHLTGFLQSNKADFCASTLIIREARMEFLNFLICPFPLETGLIFIEPPLPSVTNVFVLPFAKSIWFSYGGIIVLTIFVMILRTIFSRNVLPLEESIKLSEVGNYVLGSICQQGVGNTPTSLSDRAAFLSLLLASVSLLSAYSACIVTLMQSSSSAILSLEDMTLSDFEIGIQDSFPYFKIAVDVELHAAYKFTRKYYDEHEKCGLRVLEIIKDSPVCFTALKNSPYREIFAQRYVMQLEAGFIKRTWLRWMEQKPECEGSRLGFISIGVKEFRHVMLAFIYGVAAALIIFLAELSFSNKIFKVFRMDSTTAIPETGALTSFNFMFFSLLIPALALWYVYYRITRKRFLELASKLPGPPGYPIFGNAFDFTGKAPAIFKHVYKYTDTFTDVLRIWIGTKLVVFLANPKDLELILGSNVHIDKAPEYKYFQPWLGNGLLISSGNHWRSHRKLIAPTFHLNVLKSFITLFNQNARAVCDKMGALQGKEFDCHDYMSECTVEILLETAMGVNKKTQDKSGFEYAMAVMKMCNILHLRHSKFWLRPNFIFNLTNYKKEQESLLNIIHSLTKKVIKRKKEEWNSGIKSSLASASEVVEKPEPAKQKSSERAATEHSYGQAAGLKDDLDVDDNDIGEKKRMAFLDLMVESAQNGIVMNDTDIKEEVDTIMFEGHDTTAAGSSFFLSLMGLHKDIQERIVQELDEIFGDSDRPATFQDTLEMKYLERCIMETLRMYPPVPVIARQINEELKLESGDYTIPAGTTVIVATYRLHRDPRIYPNPDKFDPDNFLPERSANRHYYAFIPFSAGPRSCVGRKYAMLKLKIILSTILRNFKIHADIPEKDYQLQADIILKRAEGFKIRLEPRKRAGVAVA